MNANRSLADSPDYIVNKFEYVGEGESLYGEVQVNKFENIRRANRGSLYGESKGVMYGEIIGGRLGWSLCDLCPSNSVTGAP